MICDFIDSLVAQGKELKAAKVRIKGLEAELLASNDRVDKMIGEMYELYELKKRIEKCREVMSTGLGRHLMDILDGKA